jgi:hypothetical protein
MLDTRQTDSTTITTNNNNNSNDQDRGNDNCYQLGWTQRAQGVISGKP